MKVQGRLIQERFIDMHQIFAKKKVSSNRVFVENYFKKWYLSYYKLQDQALKVVFFFLQNYSSWK